MNGWKTVMLNAFVLMTGLAEMSGVVLPESFASDLNGAVLAIIGVAGIALRAVTDSPVGWRK